jgi:hypothetical protein
VGEVESGCLSDDDRRALEKTVQLIQPQRQQQRRRFFLGAALAAKVADSTTADLDLTYDLELNDCKGVL